MELITLIAMVLFPLMCMVFTFGILLLPAHYIVLYRKNDHDKKKAFSRIGKGFVGPLVLILISGLVLYFLRIDYLISLYNNVISQSDMLLKAVGLTVSFYAFLFVILVLPKKTKVKLVYTEDGTLEETEENLKSVEEVQNKVYNKEE